MENKVIVRFAPSPTGYLHIGGARTAIFNWLYARKSGGKFILRIEDTDAERSTPDAIQGIVDGLKWLGLDWDEGPNFQTQNAARHLAVADQLVQEGHAYKCFCTKQEIEAQRALARTKKETFRYNGTCRHLTPEAVARKEAQGLPYAVRLRIPEGEGQVGFEDAVYGRIVKRFEDLEDFIIVRSDRRPLYVLSNAVDDIQDRVTHIIRGQDGLANTPKQVLIYQALGAPLPVFAHMSLTLDPSRAKISKRKHGEQVAIHYYREKGFLPWAMVNFLVLLGWATPDSREIFSRDELIQAFDLSGISRTNSVFCLDHPTCFTDPKAVSINAHYIRTLPVEALLAPVKQVLEAQGIWQAAWEGDEQEWFLSALDLVRTRCRVLTDFHDNAGAYFSDVFDMDPDSVAKHLVQARGMADQLSCLAKRLRALETFNPETVEAAVRRLLKETGVKANVLVNGVRVALTGRDIGPDFVKTLVILGRERVADRLESAAVLCREKD